MASVAIEISPPRWFRLRTVAMSHGWFDLPPFEWNPAEPSLTLVARFHDRPMTITLREPKFGRLQARATIANRSTTGLEEAVEQRTRSVLGLDLDLADFYQQAGKEFAWAKRIGAGPFLRSASVFEDAVKMLATTNCSWALTKIMMTRLLTAIGDPAPGGRFAFPTAQSMAAKPESFYRETVRAGYRSRSFRQFAENVAAGRIFPETWPNYPGSTNDLVREIRTCPGLGRYAAENLCKLIGRFDGLGLDSWCLKKFPLVHGPIRGDIAKAIERRYRSHGKWRGLALWLDLTRDWHAGGSVADKTVSFESN